jgi:transcriptional regulator with XRE-family HTH domain
MINIGHAAKTLRERLGLTQRETAVALGVSSVHLCNVENGKNQPSQSLLDRYRELWGIDLYVLAWCDLGEVESLPPGIRAAASSLAKAWQKQIGELIAEHTKGSSSQCSVSAK